MSDENQVMIDVSCLQEIMRAVVPHMVERGMLVEGTTYESFVAGVREETGQDEAEAIASLDQLLHCYRWGDDPMGDHHGRNMKADPTQHEVWGWPYPFPD